jgi:hypothetical protein
MAHIATTRQAMLLIRLSFGLVFVAVPVLVKLFET